MTFFVRTARLTAVAAFVVALCTVGVRAETLNSTQWGFSIAFPCQTELGSQPVPTKVGKITMISYSCAVGQTGYFVAIADFPAGSITQQNPDAVYNGTMQGAASNAKGTVRSAVPYTLGNVTGRDVLIDVPSDNMAIHARYFLVGDRQFQVMYLGATGDENSKDALDFLNSFTLQP